ncbi:MAG TPA: hypothetical protein VIV11_35200 [Kofleriaceae bacterium]
MSLLLVGCADSWRESRTEPVPCGTEVCRPDQLCATVTAGHTCDTDSTHGPYSVLAQYCIDIPAECGDDAPTCGCVSDCSVPLGSRPCLNVYESNVSCGCF